METSQHPAGATPCKSPWLVRGMDVFFLTAAEKKRPGYKIIVGAFNDTHRLPYINKLVGKGLYDDEKTYTWGATNSYKRNYTH